MRIFITGATGLLGSRLASRLLEDGGNELSLLVRPGSEDKLEPRERVTVSVGHLNDPDAVRSAASDCTLAVHAAAKVSTWDRDPRTFDLVNIDATVNMMRVSADAGVEKILYVSSFLALDSSSDGRPLTEDDIPERREHYNDYERTKYLANRRAMRLIDEGLPVVVLYPAVMYGPGPMTAGNLVTGMVVDFMRRRMPARPGDGKPCWNFVFVEDVVEGIRAALERARAGERFILGGENVALGEFFYLLEELTGVPGPRMSLPWPAARAAGAAEELLARLFGRMPKTTRGVIDIFRRNWVFDSSRAAGRLGYSPLTLEQGLRRTIDWIRSEGLAP